MPKRKEPSVLKNAVTRNAQKQAQSPQNDAPVKKPRASSAERTRFDAVLPTTRRSMTNILAASDTSGSERFGAQTVSNTMEASTSRSTTLRVTKKVKPKATSRNSSASSKRATTTVPKTRAATQKKGASKTTTKGAKKQDAKKGQMPRLADSFLQELFTAERLDKGHSEPMNYHITNRLLTEGNATSEEISVLNNNQPMEEIVTPMEIQAHSNQSMGEILRSEELPLDNQGMGEVFTAMEIPAPNNQPIGKKVASEEILLPDNQPMEEVLTAMEIPAPDNQPIGEIVVSEEIILPDNQPKEEVFTALEIPAPDNQPIGEKVASEEILLPDNQPMEEIVRALETPEPHNQSMEEIIAPMEILQPDNQPILEYGVPKEQSTNNQTLVENTSPYSTYTMAENVPSVVQTIPPSQNEVSSSEPTRPKNTYLVEKGGQKLMVGEKKSFADPFPDRSWTKSASIISTARHLSALPETLSSLKNDFSSMFDK